jgi:predicted Zn-dependent protease
MVALALLGFLSQDPSQQAAAAMQAGRFAEAEKIYRALVKQQPSFAPWHANLGLALHSQKRYVEAIAPLERALKLGGDARLAQVLAVDYVEAKRWADAAPLLEKQRKFRDAAHAWWQGRQYDKARPLYERLEQDFADNPEFNFEYGDLLQRVDGAEAALPYLEKAQSLLPARAALGKAYVELSRWTDAIPHLEAAAPADPDLLLPLSRAYKETGRAAEAERALLEYKKRLRQ